MRWFLVLGCALGAASPATAQDMPRFLFRYDPAPGRTLHSTAELRTRSVVTGLPMLPDGITVEGEARWYATERVLGRAAGGLRVSVSVDSVRMRVREPDTPWRDAPPPPFAGQQARAVVDGQLHITAIETSAPTDGDVLPLLTGWVGTLGFAFPDTAVAVGGSFRPNAQVAFALDEDAAGLTDGEVLLGDLTLTLDSLVARGTDSLAYLRFAGRFNPRTVEETGEDGTTSAVVEGSYGGSLLWSTGWDAIVSSAMRVLVTSRVAQEGPAGAVNATIELDVTLVHRIRP